MMPGMTASPPRRRRASRLISPVKAPATVPPPLLGDWAPDDTRLDRVRRWPLPSGAGPEDVVVDAQGYLVSGGDDGRVWRWRLPAPEGGPVDGPVDDRAGGSAGGRVDEAGPPPEPELLVDTGGRPLGIEVDPRDGSLIICDAHRGLLRLSGGALTTLCDTVAGQPLVFCNNAAVAGDGTVFFTDSSDRYPVEVYKREFLEHRPNGRLLAYDPGTGRTDVLATGLHFPNGVALTPDGSALMLVETVTHRLMRFPLSGGGPVVLADLPAYPDNMSPVGDGTYWIALPSPRVPLLERLLPHPGLRRVAALLPERLQPKEGAYGLVALVDGEGRVRRTLHGPSGSYRMITGVRQHGSVLWLGSLTEGAVGAVSLE
jgi:sugar lactone lactonase YvrE